jgi:hypothetical protein
MRTGTPRPQIKTGLEHHRGFPDGMADCGFDARRNGVHRFYLVQVCGGILSLATVRDKRP